MIGEKMSSKFYEIIIPGQPIPAQRMTQKSKWNLRSKRSLEYQELVAWCAKKAKIPTFKGEVAVGFEFYRKGKQKCDLDNLIKAAADGLQYGGMVENDNQITKIFYAQVHYNCDEPYAKVMIANELQEVGE